MNNRIVNFIKDKLSNEDDKNLTINVIGAFVVKGLSLFVSLFSMPMYIKYFDNNVVLGIWYTILSLLSWISICDLGLGNGLRNKFTMAYTKGEYDIARRYTSSTYSALIVIIIPLLVIASVVINKTDLNVFLGVSEELIEAKSLRIAIQILVCGILINFVLRSINSIIYAIQKSALNNFLAFVSSILPLIYIMFSRSGTLSSNFIKLSVVHIVAINLPLIVATIIIFSRGKLRDCKPSLKYSDFTTAKSMLSVGIKFFSAQNFFMGLMSTNEILITKLFSPSDVVEYSIYYKVFMLIGSLFMLALTPLWSQVTKDLANKKYTRIKKINKLLYKIAFAAIIAEFVIVPVLQIIINIWLRESAIIVRPYIAIPFAAFGGLYIMNIVLTTVANGIGELNTQILIYGLGTVLKIPVVLLMKCLFGTWYVVVIYNCIVLGIFCIAQYIWVEHKINKLILEESK